MSWTNLQVNFYSNICKVIFHTTLYLACGVQGWMRQSFWSRFMHICNVLRSTFEHSDWSFIFVAMKVVKMLLMHGPRIELGSPGWKVSVLSITPDRFTGKITWNYSLNIPGQDSLDFILDTRWYLEELRLDEHLDLLHDSFSENVSLLHLRTNLTEFLSIGSWMQKPKNIKQEKLCTMS